MTEVDMVGWLARKINAMGPEFIVQFVDTPQEKLVRYHDSLGRMIRNEFKMWDEHWTPDIINGADCSPNHPDQRSQQVIEETWKQLQ